MNLNTPATFRQAEFNVVRQAHHERIGLITVRPEPVEGRLIQERDNKS
jgi:hypothetical protein